MGGRVTPWTEDMEEFVKEIWLDGMTASECAEAITLKFHRHLTRNAVIGKVHRMGLDRRGNTVSKHKNNRSYSKRNRRPNLGFGFHANYRKSVRTPSDAVVAVRKYGATGAFKDIEPSEYDRQQQGCAINELEPHDYRCRWPLGDPQKPDFRYCAADRVPGLSYCLHHAKRAFPKVAEATKEKEAEDVELVQA